MNHAWKRKKEKKSKPTVTETGNILNRSFCKRGNFVNLCLQFRRIYFYFGALFSNEIESFEYNS